MKVATHNGVFHADDAFAVAVLRRIHNHIEVVRTRDPKLLEAADLRVDVGGEYDHGKLTYDHHQQGGAGERNNGVPYAGFGLIWRHYGLDACDGDPLVARRVEERLVMPVDAGDNGVELFKGESLFKTDKSEVNHYTYSHAVSSMNPSWHEEDQDFDMAFREAVERAFTILDREIIRAQGAVIAEATVRAAISQMEGQVVVLDKFCPWQEIVITECPEALFTVYPSVEGDWMVQCIPPEIGSFAQRKGLPESWAGLRDQDLIDLINIPTALFCHPARFIGGAKTREDALAMAKLAVAE